jgi:hypothetical protein
MWNAIYLAEKRMEWERSRSPRPMPHVERCPHALLAAAGRALTRVGGRLETWGGGPVLLNDGQRLVQP